MLYPLSEGISSCLTLGNKNSKQKLQKGGNRHLTIERLRVVELQSTAVTSGV